MVCAELIQYAEQFGSDNVSSYVLVDGLLSAKLSPEVFAMLSGWMNDLPQD